MCIRDRTWLNGVRDACTWYDALKADGKFGVGTQRAVQEFQLKNKMNMEDVYKRQLLLVPHKAVQLVLHRPGSLVQPNDKNTAIKAALAFFHYTGPVSYTHLTMCTHRAHR